MGIFQRLMARYYDRAMLGYERHASERRHSLLEQIPKGARVLELGPGTGVNLVHLAAENRTDIQWLGVEPNPHMRKKLRAKIAGLSGGPKGVEFAGLDANHRIQTEGETADVVLSTLVLCSVRDPELTLTEVRRVLAKDGRFLFMEHVGANPGTHTRRFQSLVTPIWRQIADGCCLNRNTEATIRRTGFASVEAEAYPMHSGGAPFFVRPHVAGCAIK